MHLCIWESLSVSTQYGNKPTHVINPHTTLYKSWKFGVLETVDSGDTCFHSPPTGQQSIQGKQHPHVPPSSASSHSPARARALTSTNMWLERRDVVERYMVGRTEKFNTSFQYCEAKKPFTDKSSFPNEHRHVVPR